MTARRFISLTMCVMLCFQSQFTTQFVSAAVQEEHRQYSSPKIGEEHLSESKKKNSRWSS